MNSYYGVKDQDYHSSFIEAEWLTPYEVLVKLQLKPNTHLPTYLGAHNHDHHHQLGPPPLIYPNELVYSSEPPKQLVDAILIAKYTAGNNNNNNSSYNNHSSSSTVVRLKSVLLSQLLAAPHAPLLVLSLPKDTYRWSKVANVNLMPTHALRVGFDNVARQFAYIGRLKLDHLLRSSGGQQHHQAVMTSLSCQSLMFGCSNSSNLFGSLINVYEYIPAILMQLNDISSLNHYWSGSNSDTNTSVWSRLRQTASNRLPSFVVSSLSSSSSSTTNYSNNFNYNNNNNNNNQQLQYNQFNNNNNQALQPIDFNLTTTNYEVLCLLKQPATLKQLVTQQLIRYDDEDARFAHAIRTLPNSLRCLIVPAYLTSGQCVIRCAKMRSMNYVYELGVSAYGVLRFVKRESGGCGEKQVATVEKYVESLLVLKSGVYLVFDSSQTTRRPLVLYHHRPTVNPNNGGHQSFDSFYVELTNDGYLRVVTSGRARSQDIYNLNEYFQPVPVVDEHQLTSTTTTTTSLIEKQALLMNTGGASSNNNMIVRQDSLININLRVFLEDLRSLPVKILNIVLNVLKSVVATVFYGRRTAASARVNRRAL